MPPENSFTRLFLPIPKFHEIHQLFNALAPHLPRHAIERRMEFHILERRKLIVQARVLKHDTKRFPRAALVMHRIFPVKQ